jgi:RNA polymerase sigma factor (sigma-70 family)
VTRGFRATAKRNIRREVSLGNDEGKDDALQHLTSEEPSPSAYVATCEEQARLNAALDRLPAHYAEIIRLRNLDYLPFLRIAEIVGTTTDGARKLWERAIERLTRELDSAHDNS